MHVDDTALILRAAQDERTREELILRHEKNILRIASRAKHRFVTKSDDEWSIALCAFSRAIDTYCEGKGKFLSYAETLIRRSLVDAYRAETKRAGEWLVPPETLAGEGDEGAQNPVAAAVAQRSMQSSDAALRDEICAANAELQRFGFSFYDLTRCSPARGATRADCLRAAEAMLARQDEMRRLFHAKQLPVGLLTKTLGFSKKLIERYRKYIIAITVIRAGDFPLLSGYLRNARGDGK